MVRLRCLSTLYNVEWLGSFIAVLSKFINTAYFASSEYLIFGAARAILYMIFS
jgi:hypothetical protein